MQILDLLGLISELSGLFGGLEGIFPSGSNVHFGVILVGFVGKSSEQKKTI